MKAYCGKCKRMTEAKKINEVNYYCTECGNDVTLTAVYGLGELK